MGKLEDELKSRIEFHYGSIPKFAKEIGMSPQTIYSVLKSGITGGSMSTVLPILAKLGIDSNWIIRNRLIEVGSNPNEFFDCPVYGKIAAGRPIEMEDVEDTFPVPEKVHGKYPDSFLLKVEGESMNRILPNGCYALVDPCDDVDEDMQPYAVCVNGYDATVKRVRKLNNGFQLVPDSTDPTYSPKTYNYNEPDTETVSVIGKVVWYCVPFGWGF